MTDSEEIIAEVLRLDAESTPGPWRHEPRWGDIFDESSDPPFSCRRGETRREDDGAAIVGADNVEVIHEGTFEPYEQTAGVLGAAPADAALIAYYRTAAPALAREVQRLQDRVSGIQISHECALVAAYESGRRAGQEAMRERAAALCRERQEKHRRGRIRCGPGKKFGKLQVAEDEAFSCVSAIRTLEVE